MLFRTRQSVAMRIRLAAMERGISVSRYLRELVEAGIDSEKRT